MSQLQQAAELTLAQLAPALRRAVWLDRKWLGCSPPSREVRGRLELYAAVAARDGKAIVERASALLAAPAAGDDDWRRYLLQAAMLGAQATGKRDEARRLWAAYGPALYPGGNLPATVVYLVEFDKTPGA